MKGVHLGHVLLLALLSACGGPSDDETHELEAFLNGTAKVFALLTGRHGTSSARALDLATPALLSLLAVGRVGCFLAGCDAGGITDWPSGLRFPAGTEVFHDHLARGLIAPDDLRSLAVHPAQLYEASGALVLAFTVRSLAKRGLAPGVGSAISAATYAVLRMSVDQCRPRGLDSAAAELTSIAVLAVAVAWLWAQLCSGNAGARALKRVHRPTSN